MYVRCYSQALLVSSTFFFYLRSARVKRRAEKKHTYTIRYIQTNNNNTLAQKNKWWRRRRTVHIEFRCKYIWTTQREANTQRERDTIKRRKRRATKKYTRINGFLCLRERKKQATIIMKNSNLVYMLALRIVFSRRCWIHIAAHSIPFTRSRVSRTHRSVNFCVWILCVLCVLLSTAVCISFLRPQFHVFLASLSHSCHFSLSLSGLYYIGCRFVRVTL